MRLQFQAEGGEPRLFDFSELSDGQRVLLALYTLLAVGGKPGMTMCLDEPDNFLALREIQPWLAALLEANENGGAQILMISHHPEAVDYLVADHGVWMSRDANGPCRAAKFAPAAEAMLASELIARGWQP